MIRIIALAGVLVFGADEGRDEAVARTTWNVMDYGAVADGTGDNTQAFSEALAAARTANGGVVEAPAGRYRFDGALTIPKDVALRGVSAYSPAHAGIRDEGLEKPVYGTVLEPYADAGNEDGTPFITIQANAALQGVTIHYPEQDPKAGKPTAYPWAVCMRDNNPALIDVQLLNPYNGIDASNNQRALIRNIHGQPIHIGLYVDRIYDIGRIENVHWNPWWSIGTPVFEWQREHGIGFLFEKTDWHYVHNTFCFGYNIGYKFAASDRGGTNGNFLGIGADYCHTAVLVEQSEPMGILITNGEFVAFDGEDPTMIRVEKTHTGTVRFTNCAFWGPSNRNVVMDGPGTVGFTDCTFTNWSHKDKGLPAIDALGGSLLVRGCEFVENKPQIRLGPDVERAIITENLITGKERIESSSTGAIIVRDNASSPMSKKWKKKRRAMPGRRAQELRRDDKTE